MYIFTRMCIGLLKFHIKFYIWRNYLHYNSYLFFIGSDMIIMNNELDNLITFVKKTRITLIGLVIRIEDYRREICCRNRKI